LHAVGYPTEQLEQWRQFSVQAATPLAESVRLRKSIFVKSPEELATRYPAIEKSRLSQHNSFTALPLIVEDRVLGGIGFSFDEPQSFDQADQNFIQALAQQCAQALERARLYEVERQARLEAEASQQRNILLAEARERNRLAQELHDNIAQILGFVNIKVATISNVLSEESQIQVKDDLDELKQAISEAYTDVREEIFNLRSKITSGFNFMEMLQRYVDKYKQFYHLDVHLSIQMDEETLTAFPSEVSLQVIRFIQEALINVRKHAGVNEAFLHFYQDGEELCIRVEDEGNGFDVETVLNQADPSFGMQIMQERVKAAGGRLKLDSLPGQGTRLTVHVPLKQEHQPDSLRTPAK
jgi:signal transduction histidine kinase